MKKKTYFRRNSIVLLLTILILGIDVKVSVCQVIINKNLKDVAPTPPMGWNTWNWFGKKDINEMVVREEINSNCASYLNA